MRLKFGLHVPTCAEGMMHLIPFASPGDLAPMGVLAERCGFDSVWGNDHMNTQNYVRRQFPTPPNYFEPLVTFTWIAAHTTRLKVCTCVLVLPMCHVAVAAKQVATLDQLSGGRVILGVGAGAYREEYEALFPAARGAHRGTIVEEGMKAMRALFTERRVTFKGDYVRLDDVESFPKPVQDPLPMYAGGNHPNVRRRAGELGEGWMPTALSPAEIRAGTADVHRAAEKAGRDGTKIEIAPQLVVAIGRTHEEAMKRFHASQLYRCLESLRQSTLKAQGTGGHEERNLIGSPEGLCERIRKYQDAGVTTFAGMLFVGDTVAEMNDNVEMFGREVIPHFA